MRALSLTGQRFGRLTALALAHHISGRVHWVCQCECGTVKSVRATHLKSGRVVSCGCHRADALSQIRTTHGKSDSRVYRIWRDMINRCHYDKYPERHLYGGRGITVCDRWRKSFKHFLSDMGDPADHLSIDRYPDNNGNYEPGNCRWATATQQARNKRKK